MILRVSRYRFWYGYLLLFCSVTLSIWCIDNGFDLYSWILGILSGILFIVLELLIRFEVLVVNGKDVELRRGLFSQTVEHYSISNIHQNTFQKMLRIGNVELKHDDKVFIVKCLRDVKKVIL